uniref:IP01157p n=1 Tax=Drosophila melanogaster TaxID=7227 RepID=Q4V6W5_DROME|nr:IP01157p [Drosophila melanogaster]
MVQGPRTGETHVAVGANVPLASLAGVQVPLQVAFQLIAGRETRLALLATEGHFAGVSPTMDLQIPIDARPIAAELAHKSPIIGAGSWTFRRHGRSACAKSNRRHYC